MSKEDETTRTTRRPTRYIGIERNTRKMEYEESNSGGGMGGVRGSAPLTRNGLQAQAKKKRSVREKQSRGSILLLDGGWAQKDAQDEFRAVGRRGGDSLWLVPGRYTVLRQLMVRHKR
jgi:hypothetical protein